MYFVTICARNRECLFGGINNPYVGAGLAPAHIELTAIGQIIDIHWQDIPNQHRHVNIDEYIIMPNHIHGILIIRAAARAAPTLGQVIGAFKSRCVIDYLKYIRHNNLNELAKIWQRNYYDHIIRNDKSLTKIRQYIINNPATWADDRENVNRPRD